MGQQAQASAEAFPQEQFNAQLDWIAPVVDPSRGTIDVKFTVPSPPTYLKPEMTVQVTVHVARHENALVVPPELLFALESSQPYLLRVRNRRLERVNVTVGLRAATSIEVVKGLELQDEVAVPTPKMPAVGAVVRPQYRK